MINLLGSDNVIFDEYSKEIYGKDNTEDLLFLPDIIVKPSTANEVSEILKFANKYKIPVTPRGGGTGLSGGALPCDGGILLSLERMNRILEIDERNFQVIVEPGVITEVLQKECEKKNMFYPVDPASSGSCFIGGNVAECAGGPRAVKYGVTKDYILSLEVVLPNGKIINTGSRTLKNVVGYNLTQLFVGSEGTLGIITKIILKLIPLPKIRKALLIAFNSPKECIASVAEFFRQSITPSALEFMEKDAIKAAEKHLDKVFPNSNAEAQLLLELDGDMEENLYYQMEKISEIAEKFGAFDIIIADDKTKVDELWLLRKSIGEAVKAISVYKEEDTVVPRYFLPDLLLGVKGIAEKYNLKTICYGHAGDGNLHVNILKENMSDEDWNSKINYAIEEIFRLTVSLNGTISGEHGIGYTQKRFLKIALSEAEIDLMKSIKRLFDPNNILNPNKIFLYD
ncbi:MAG: FAD-binding protein [Ignavibacteria bacterium]|nr:FAD-binding protein [Ignavibacteria bacterium]